MLILKITPNSGSFKVRANTSFKQVKNKISSQATQWVVSTHPLAKLKIALHFPLKSYWQFLLHKEQVPSFKLSFLTNLSKNK